MDFQKLYDFLRELNTGDNNDKSWMDVHRSEYVEVRDSYISFLEELNHISENPTLIIKRLPEKRL